MYPSLNHTASKYKRSVRVFSVIYQETKYWVYNITSSMIIALTSSIVEPEL